MTPEDLAAQIGRAASTVRAHENGQNRITAEMADIYAAALHTSPAWLLWGEPVADAEPSIARATPGPAPRAVEIVGTIENHIRPTPALPKRWVYIVASDYDDFPLQAFVIGTSSRGYKQGDYVVTAPVSVGVRDGDVVVTRMQKGDGDFFALHQLIWTSAGTYLKAISQDAGDLSSAQLPEGVVDRHFKKGSALIEGVVVAYGGQERPLSGRIISPERLSDVFVKP